MGLVAFSEVNRQDQTPLQLHCAGASQACISLEAFPLWLLKGT